MFVIRVIVAMMVGMVVVAVVGYCTVLSMVVGMTVFLRVDILVIGRCILCNGGSGINEVVVMVMMIVWC